MKKPCYRFMVGMFSVLLIAAADPKDDPAKKDAEKIHGMLSILSAELDGKPDEGRKNAKISIQGDTFTRTSAGQTVKGTYKLDPLAKPITINITFTEGPNKGQTWLGICALEGDTIKICASQAGKPRPNMSRATRAFNPNRKSLSS